MNTCRFCGARIAPGLSLKWCHVERPAKWHAAHYAAPSPTTRAADTRTSPGTPGIGDTDGDRLRPDRG